MKLPKVRELGEAIKALVSRPYTSKFPAAPHTPYASFRGQPKFDDAKCVGCLACESACPAEAISHQDQSQSSPPKRVMMHYTDTCIFCGSCEAVCIADHEGIKLSNDWELAFFDRQAAFETIEKELILCEICGAVIACRDHLQWISAKLGELAYSNPTLYQNHLKSLGILDENIIAAVKDQWRSDRMKILCARCRRETTKSD